jgi:hypothetical protein
MKNAFAFVLLLLGMQAYAAPIADPTRPPSVSFSEDGGAVVPAGPRLESVLIAPDRRIAVISGQAVKVGDPYGDGQVLRITESEVVLRTGDATETLKLFPDVDKKPRARREKRTKP